MKRECIFKASTAARVFRVIECRNDLDEAMYYLVMCGRKRACMPCLFYNEHMAIDRACELARNDVETIKKGGML